MSELLHAILLEAAFDVRWEPFTTDVDAEKTGSKIRAMIDDPDPVFGAPSFRRAYLKRLHDRDGTMLLEIVVLEDATRRIEQWIRAKSA